MPIVMPTALPTTHRLFRQFRTAPPITGPLAQTWGREHRILTLPSCIRGRAGMLLAMRSLPTVTPNQCSRRPCLPDTQVPEDVSHTAFVYSKSAKLKYYETGSDAHLTAYPLDI